MRIGIDLGGTKTEIICLDKHNGKELYRQRIPTIRGDYHKTVESLVHLIQQAEATIGKTGTVGIGIPGAVSGHDRIKSCNCTWLIGQPLAQDLGTILNRPIRLENDANCFAVSEATDGAGEDKKIVLGVIIGTGCGAGIAINGVAHAGMNALAGEWGHNPLPFAKPYVENADAQTNLFETLESWDDQHLDYFVNNLQLSEYPGPMCYCGKRGCLETWISGTGFKNDYKRVTGEDKSTHDIIAAIKQRDQRAIDAMARYTDRLARALAYVINIFDPDVIILGGGMSNVSSLYTEVPKIWGKYIFTKNVDTVILPPRHGDSSGVRGAAWLWGKDE